MKGSLINRLMENSRGPEPEVGMGCTLTYWTDRSAATVVEVLSPTKIVVQGDIAYRTDSNGMSECQSYNYARNPKAPRVVFRKRKNGSWVKDGEPMKGGQVVILGTRQEYYDFSF